jgi:adenosylcobyric acid synthase
MVCGTASDAGKSVIVAGLCRLLARDGVRVAPFKAQNMALNSFVTAAGHEIGRAQAAQAFAARVDPEVAMNPILLKPTAGGLSQVIVNGVPIGHLTAAEYHQRAPQLLSTVLEALADLRARFEVVVCEGAGSPAEINLLDHDIVNLRVAHEAGFPAIVVGDIDRGGVFAALYGTVGLLPSHLRACVGGFVLNKFRGDPALLGDGPAELRRRCGVPTFGVLPFVRGLAIDSEDSLALEHQPVPAGPPVADPLEVAVVRLPRVSNITDLDPLALEPGVTVRLVEHPSHLATADLVVLPGSKATVSDLAWLQSGGFDEALRTTAATVLGICGGAQMLGRSIRDDVESNAGTVQGLGLLDATTTFHADKVTRQSRGTSMGQRVHGYQVHHGRITRGAGAAPWLYLDDEEEGAVDNVDRRVLATSLHGLFEADSFRAAFLAEVGRRLGKTFVPAGVSFEAAREAKAERLADLLADNLDVDALRSLIASGSSGMS